MPAVPPEPLAHRHQAPGLGLPPVRVRARGAGGSLMARVKIHTPCMRPLSECDCPPDDDEPGADRDGSDEGDEA